MYCPFALNHMHYKHHKWHVQMGLSNLQIITIVIYLLNRKMFEEVLHGESLSELVGSESFWQ